MPYIGTPPASELANLDINGQKLILDADADTSITSDTDDQIDVEISGADDFRFTANTFTALSGSTIDIASGATIANSGTATGFGVDMESAYTGVLQTNANFVDQVIFGPAVDGRAWNGLWNKASLFSSLMLATIEDEGSNTEINIWDLTEQSAGTISTTPLGTVDLSSAATPTDIDACMGYIIVGCEDGIHIIDPHSGAWAERTVGWPRTLSTSTAPALTNNDVGGVAAGLALQPAYDPRTGGGLPTFAVALNAGTDAVNIIHTDGSVYDWNGTYAGAGGRITIDGGRAWFTSDTTVADSIWSSPYFENISADDWAGTIIVRSTGISYGFAANTSLSNYNGLGAGGSTSGLTLYRHHDRTDGGTAYSMTNVANRTYTTGYMVGDIRGAWLANSKTVDRSYKANTLTENGTVTEAAVESSAELLGYSGLSTTNYLSRASDADWDNLGTGGFSLMGWVKTTSSSGDKGLVGFGNADGSDEAVVYIGSGVLKFVVDGAAGTIGALDGIAVSTNVWHHFACVHVSSTERYIYQDGVQVASSTTDTGSISDSGNMPLTIGCHPDGPSMGATTETLSLIRLSATAPTATQVRQMYDAEKGMFVASAECLLQSGSTDAVLDVNVDPLTNKVLVTQTDAITVFDGLVVDSKPTVNSGSSEKGKLWGDLRAEQNSANAYVTAPAVDQRQVNEMVRGLASDLPKGVDLSKAKAWCQWSGSGTAAINSSYNVKSLTDLGTGNYEVAFAIPFKKPNSGTATFGGGTQYAFGSNGQTTVGGTNTRFKMNIQSRNSSGTLTDDGYMNAIAFGELENE